MTVQVLVGDAREVLRTLPDASVHMCVTSPPYFNLRDYGVAGQIGLEDSPDAWIAEMVKVFREVGRVLRPDGTCWVNCGDSYAGSGNGSNDHRANGSSISKKDDKYLGQRPRTNSELKPKDLIGIPWMLAFALRADGWWLRSEITWCKRSCMPESVTDRPTSATEKIFLFSKQPRYFYDSNAVAEEAVYAGQQLGIVRGSKRRADAMNVRPSGNEAPGADADIAATRNMRNYWLLGPEPFSEAHFATYVTEIPRRAILAGTSERGCCPECGAPWVRVVEAGERVQQTNGHTGAQASIPPRGLVGATSMLRDGKVRERHAVGWRPSCGHAGEPVPCTVLDPFFGAGTTGLVSDRLNRSCIGIEINRVYAEMARRRIAGDSPMFTSVDVA